MDDILYPTVGEFHVVNLPLTVPAFTWNPAGCVTSQTWSHNTTPLAPFINPNEFDTGLTIDTNGILDDPTVCFYCADYEVKILAVPQPINVLVPLSATFTGFKLKVYEPCSITSLKPTDTSTNQAVHIRNLQEKLET